MQHPPQLKKGFLRRLDLLLDVYKRQSVIRATVSIPAAQDDITLSAEAVSSEYTVTATSQSGATVSSGLTKLGKGEAYTMTTKPDGNLYCITRADLTIGQNKTSVALSKGCRCV